MNMTLTTTSIHDSGSMLNDRNAEALDDEESLHD